MKLVHFYSLSTGIFTGQSFSWNGRDSVLAANIPTGCGAHEGDIDFLSQRIDLETGLVAGYQPPQPDADHEWNETSRRWEKRAAVVARENRRNNGLARIAELESKQARIEREIRLRPADVGSDGKTPLQRLEELDAEIVRVRGTLNGETETTSP